MRNSQSKTDGGYSLNNVHPVRVGKLIALTPLECERLQGFRIFGRTSRRLGQRGTRPWQ